MEQPKNNMELYAHQKELLELNPAKCGIFFGMGAGKTAVAIKLADKNAFRAVVVVPKSLKEQWRGEIAMWRSKCEFIVYTKEEFKKKIDKIPQTNCLICDEVHIAGANWKSQLHGAIAYYLKKNNVQFVYLLTGTPYTSTCWSIYSIGKLLGRDWKWYDWKKRFFYDVKMGGRYIPVQRKGIEEEIAEITNKIGFTKRLDELIDVPEQTFLTEYFDLNKEQKKMINSLTDVLPIVRFTKIHQIEQGCLKSDGYSDDWVTDCEKTNRIIELCEYNPKIAIAARYNLQLEHYKNVLSKKFPERTIYIINGETENKSEIVDKINDSNDAILLINAMCSVGFNLYSVPLLVFASLDFSYTNFVQLAGRLLRINHPKKNVYITLITNGKSIDKEVARCVEDKKDFNIAIYDRETISDKVFQMGKI